MTIDFILLMGVSGSGKTAIGKPLAEKLGWHFFDGDYFHPPENYAKMANGIPLNDNDRHSWLLSLNQLITNCQKLGMKGVLASSALKEKYRTTLVKGTTNLKVVYLKGDYDLILKRVSPRQGHFMQPNMLASQFAILEEPEDAIVVEVDQTIEAIIDEIMVSLSQANEE